MNLLSHEGVISATRVLNGVVHRTPVFESRSLNERLGARIVMKGEHLQRAGAFKFRGAYHSLSLLNEEERNRGVLTFSSGNHAGGLALAGKLLGISVTVAMPSNAIPLKRDATAGYGAELVECPAAEREEVGRKIAAERGLTIIHPYDYEPIIAGQGTAALELMEQVPGIDLLATPLGGGGLLAGTALAASNDGPDVFGVEPEIANDGARSFHSSERVILDSVPETIADGLRTRFVGERNLAVFREHVTDIVTVTEEEIAIALRWIWIRMKLLVEPSGAVPLAGILSGKLPVEGKTVGLILSGGNAEPRAVADLISDVGDF